MRSVQRGFSLIELIMVIGLMTVLTVGFVSIVSEPNQKKIVINQRAESGEITAIRPKTELISIESSVREHEMNSAPTVGETLSEMASQPAIKPKAKVYEPGKRQTTEAF